MRGRTFLAEDYRPGAPHVCAIAYRLWQRRYSSANDIVGRAIELDGERYTIVGVMPAQFQFPLNVYSLWVPWIFSDAELAKRRDHGLIIYRDCATAQRSRRRRPSWIRSQERWRRSFQTPKRIGIPALGRPS